MAASQTQANNDMSDARNITFMPLGKGAQAKIGKMCLVKISQQQSLESLAGHQRQASHSGTEAPTSGMCTGQRQKGRKPRVEMTHQRPHHAPALPGKSLLGGKLLLLSQVIFS